jgi:hypothetical protein
MRKYLAAIAMTLGLAARPALAAEQPASSNGPVMLSDNELDQVSAGDPLILVSVMAPIGVHIEPITVSVPVNVAAIIQANVLGNAAFDAVAVGTQNVFNTLASVLPH